MFSLFHCALFFIVVRSSRANVASSVYRRAPSVRAYELGTLHESSFVLDAPMKQRKRGLGFRRTRNSTLRGLDATSEMEPLYEGYGTHFAYAYVGNPPQRQSLIIDTGSHQTAFPCKGCEDCGKHTDEAFDPAQSSTKSDCVHYCLLTQRYAEGSSWIATKMVDAFFLASEKESQTSQAKDLSIPFEFGCQTQLTGLFKTQLANGCA
jgi:hypothetical protein